MANAHRISRNSRAGSAVGNSSTNRSQIFIDQELTNQLDDIQVANPALITAKSQASVAAQSIQNSQNEQIDIKSESKKSKKSHSVYSVHSASKSYHSEAREARDEIKSELNSSRAMD